jgi:hypothetical protein
MHLAGASRVNLVNYSTCLHGLARVVALTTHSSDRDNNDCNGNGPERSGGGPGRCQTCNLGCWCVCSKDSLWSRPGHISLGGEQPWQTGQKILVVMRRRISLVQLLVAEVVVGPSQAPRADGNGNCPSPSPCPQVLLIGILDPYFCPQGAKSTPHDNPQIYVFFCLSEMSTLQSAALAAGLWQCQQCGHTNNADNN